MVTPRRKPESKPKPTPPKPICIACGNTGKNSKGYDCIPCLMKAKK